MALSKFIKDMNIIAPLDTLPNDRGGFSPEMFKGKFDEAGLALQNFINEVLIPETESAIAAAVQGVPPDQGIDGAILVDDSVRGEKLADGAVSGAKIADGGISTEKLAAGSVTGVKIASRSIGREQLSYEARMAKPEDFPNSSVPGAALIDGSLTTAKYADGSISGAKLAGEAVTAAKLAADAKALAFAVTLSASGWAEGAQTVNSTNFRTGGYKYDVAPSPISLRAYAEAGIYAEDISTAGQMRFVCEEVPDTDLSVYISRVVTA